MDAYFHYNAFEDIVFPYDMGSSLSFFDLSTDVIDNVVKTEYLLSCLRSNSRPDASDSMLAAGDGDTFTAIDYASFVMGELQELGEPDHSEPDFATSIASDSPFPRLSSITPTPSAAPAAATEIDGHLKYLSDESVSPPYFTLLTLVNFILGVRYDDFHRHSPGSKLRGATHCIAIYSSQWKQRLPPISANHPRLQAHRQN